MKKTFTLKEVIAGKLSESNPGDEVVFMDSQTYELGMFNSCMFTAKVLERAICMNCVVVSETKKLGGLLYPDTITTIAFEPSPFAKKVKEMREAQNEYFKTRSKDSIARAKRLESEVDKLLP